MEADPSIQVGNNYSYEQAVDERIATLTLSTSKVHRNVTYVKR